MILPNADRAFVEPAKVRDYLLSDVHPVGQYKAVFFEALGFRASAWHVLRDALLLLARTEPATPTHRTEHGQKYEVRGTLRAHPFRRAGRDGPDRAPQRGLSAVRDRVSGVAVKFQLLDVVVLVRDLPAHGLARGDLGTVVEVYAPDGLEVEFVQASGRTRAVLTLRTDDVRPIDDDDMLAVRSTRRAAG